MNVRFRFRFSGSSPKNWAAVATPGGACVEDEAKQPADDDYKKLNKTGVTNDPPGQTLSPVR